jgi:hypothetical protein
MKTTNYDSNSNSGKKIAVILILMFFGINFFRSANEAGPQEKKFAAVREAKAQDRKFDNNITKRHDIQKLRFAYTGTWEPNGPQHHSLDDDGTYDFHNPENNRNMVPTGANKAKDDKKKKLAKKTKTTFKVAKKYKKSKRLGSDSDFYEDGDGRTYTNTAYYTRQPVQERNPSDEEKNKKLSVQEWIEKVLAANNVSELVGQFQADPGLFYSVVEFLLSSDQDQSKKLGFTALQQTPSVGSFAKYVKHINDEMSSDVKTFALSTVDVYNNPSQLNILNSSLKNSDNEVKIQAAIMIKNITTTILQAESSSGEQVVYTPAQIESFKKMLAQSLAVIESALKTPLDAEVLASFTATRAVLTEFLG